MQTSRTWYSSDLRIMSDDMRSNLPLRIAVKELLALIDKDKQLAALHITAFIFREGYSLGAHDN